MTQRYQYTVLDLIETAARNSKVAPLNLGGIAGIGGGAGGPPGGFIGWLPQTRVAYDETEAATLFTPSSGMSLLDNLNHIRYRLNMVESGILASGITVIDDNTSSIYLDIDTIHFSGAGVTVLDLGNGDVQVIITAGSGVASSGGAIIAVGEQDGSPLVSNVDTILFSGATVLDLGNGDVLVSIVAGSGGTALTVEEYDGSPSVTNVDKIIFSGLVVTDLGSGDVMVSAEPTVGSGGTPLTVEELDGDPSVANVDKIIFSGATVTNLGSGDVLVSIESIGAGTTVLHKYNDDLTSQIPTQVFDTSLVYMSGTLRVYYNGVRQRKGVHYVDDVEFSTFSTYFATYSGDVMIVDYNYTEADQVSEIYLTDTEDMSLLDSEDVEITDI